jgi:TolA-binding protein
MSVTPPPHDPTRHTPKPPPAVAAAAAEAERLMAEQAQPSGGGEAPAPQDAPPELPPLPAPPPSPTSAPPPTTPPEVAHVSNDMENRWKAAQGRVNKQAETIRDLNGRIGQLETVIASMNAARPIEQAQPEVIAPLVSHEEEEEYGKDLLDVVAKKARDTLAPELGEMRVTLEQLRAGMNNVGKVMTMSAKERFQGEMTQNLPDWRQQNRDPGFLQWLDEIEPYSGRVRSEMIKEAADLHDTRRVLSFFQGYRSEVAAVDPRRGQSNQGAPSNGGIVSKVSLDQLAAPGRATSAAPIATGPAQKPVYTTSQIAALYTAKAAGKYRGRENDFAAFEADLFQAQHEGRVINR